MSKVSLNTSLCKSAKHVTDALKVRMLSKGPFIVEDNNRWFYLKGKSCRVYFSVAFACLIVSSRGLVFIMQIHASPKPTGSSMSKIVKSSSQRSDAFNIVERYSNRMWPTLPPYESDFHAYVESRRQKVKMHPKKSMKDVSFLFF